MATAEKVAISTDPAKALAGFVDTVARSRLASAAAILIVALVCFLPGLVSLPPLDSDEARYAVVAKHMVTSGDYVDMRLQGEEPSPEPPGVYWLQAAAVKLLGNGAATPFWVYRLPSLIGALAATLLTWWTVLAFGRPRAALFAGLVLAVSVTLSVEARIARPDAVLVALITLAEGALARIWLDRESRRHPGLAFLAWTAVGLGILIKGAVAPLIFVLTLAMLSARAGSTRWLVGLAPLRGILWTLIVASPWAIAAFLAWREGALIAISDPAVIAAAATPGAQGLLSPPGTYVLFLPLILGGATPLFLLAVPWILDHWRRPAVVFATAWLLPFWAVMALTPFKLPNLILPAVPAIAILMGLALDGGGVRIAGAFGWLASLPMLLLAPLVTIAAFVGFYYLDGRVPYAAIVPLAAGIVLSGLAWRWLAGGEAILATILTVLSGVFIYAGLFGALFPQLAALRVSGRLIEAGKAAVTCPDPRFAVAGYPEQSLMFLLANRAPMTTAEGAADFLGAGGCRVAFVEHRQVSSFRQRAEDIGLEVLDRGKVTGLNLGRAQQVDVRVYAPKDLTGQ